jgi:16S rRNA (guanine(966)-N(2))-methyltransferase RsmD
MRIVAGTHGGRRLIAPRGRDTRPTSDRVREALFSILGERVDGARVLDLFAGTGALGLEALSRGAAEATFVDRDAAAVAAVRANLEALGLRAAVHRRDALAFLRGGAGPFDLAFLDPPYREAAALAPRLADTLPAALAADALVVSESDRRAPLDLGPLATLDERRYGDTLIRLHG